MLAEASARPDVAARAGLELKSSETVLRSFRNVPRDRPNFKGSFCKPRHQPRLSEAAADPAVLEGALYRKLIRIPRAIAAAEALHNRLSMAARYCSGRLSAWLHRITRPIIQASTHPANTIASVIIATVDQVI